MSNFRSGGTSCQGILWWIASISKSKREKHSSSNMCYWYHKVKIAVTNWKLELMSCQWWILSQWLELLKVKHRWVIRALEEIKDLRGLSASLQQPQLQEGVFQRICQKAAPHINQGEGSTHPCGYPTPTVIMNLSQCELHKYKTTIPGVSLLTTEFYKTYKKA